MRRIAVVTGGRDYAMTEDQVAALFTELKARHITHLFHGGCTGVDSKATIIANHLGLETVEFLPARKLTGIGVAGPARNRRMCKLAKRHDPRAVLFAFPGHIGTRSCRRAAVKLGLQVVEF